MSTGKIVSQTGHAMVEMMKNAKQKDIRKWRHLGEPIITLAVPDLEEMKFIYKNVKDIINNMVMLLTLVLLHHINYLQLFQLVVLYIQLQ